MKILIAVPSMDQVPVQFTQSLSMLYRVGDCSVAFQVGSLIYTSRNHLAGIAIEQQYDYVMWFDSDMVFQPDTLQRMMDLMQKNDYDILTGLYFRRVYPFKPVLFSKLEPTDTGWEWDEPDTIPDEPFELAGCGFGCVLMKTDVLMDVQAQFNDMFGPIKGMGEDLSFCWRATECGYKVICDPSISLGHVGHMVVDRQFYETIAGQIKKEVKDA